jgi:predicted  nucleic acid-binding Zn-ribbon protein
MQLNTQPYCTASGAINPANASAELEHHVSVPADMLNSLLTSTNDLKSSVNTLQDAVSKLQDENQGLRDELKATKTDVVILRENSGVKFPQFAMLPVELRR